MYEFFTNLISQETKENGDRNFLFEVNITLLKMAADKLVSEQLELISQEVEPSN